MDMTVKAFDNQRLFDLVRYMRHELRDAGLVTEGELGWLIEQGSSSARRLEDYDKLHERLKRLDKIEAALADKTRELEEAEAALRVAPDLFIRSDDEWCMSEWKKFHAVRRVLGEKA